MASASVFDASKYNDVTLPAWPALLVRPTCCNDVKSSADCSGQDFRAGVNFANRNRKFSAGMLQHTIDRISTSDKLSYVKIFGVQHSCTVCMIHIPL